MRLHDYLILIAGWLAWISPFVFARFIAQSSSSHGESVPQSISGSQAGSPAYPTASIDRRARWGVLLQSFAFAIQWQGRFWLHQPHLWQWSLCAAFILLATILAWASILTLGRHWRIDASIRIDHQLVRTGAYRLVRHPIYTSMLCLLIGTGLLISTWPLFFASMIVFLIGTQIRVNREEALLAAHFGEEFYAYQKRVGAYIPYI